jgi:hypothetical protein
VDRGESLNSKSFLLRARKSVSKQIDEAIKADFVIPQPSGDYYLRDRGKAKHVLKILRRVDPSDDLLLRGLAKFQSALYLIRLPPFMEEAAVAAFVSREAAFLMIKENLERERGQRCKLDDVTAHIREVFPTGEPFADVLDMDHEARLMFVHPKTEFGVYWCPPVFRQECYDSVKTLMHLYRYILLGAVWNPTDEEQ